MTQHSTKLKKPTRHKRFFIGLPFVILGVIAMGIAIAINSDWTGGLFAGGFVSFGLGLIIAKADAIDIIASLLQGL